MVYSNANVTVEYNQILQNGGIAGAGGIGIYSGATGYRIRNNWIVGNFTRGSGGGIAHEGLSPGGLIANNVIAFNEVFYGTPAPNVAVSGDGGGIFIAGETAAVAGGLGTGAGSVTIANNLIQGNLAGAGHGGGIRAAGVNGNDVSLSGNSNNWYALQILNNVIVNNAAGFYGGGISLQDATRVSIINNTLANNDSAATAQGAFVGAASVSTPGAAGIMAHQHSATLAGLSGQLFCDPVLRNNILWHNRSFAFDKTVNALTPNPGTPAYVDLAAESGFLLSPRNCLLSPGVPGYANNGNLKANPSFVAGYVNTNYTAVVIDEAGNNISLRFAPISLFKPGGNDTGDYHIQTGSPAILAGAGVAGIPALATDFDNESRNLVRPDIGADQFAATGRGIVPPPAPNLTVPISGPLPTGAAPPITTPITSAGVPPGPMLAPLPINPLPGDPFNPLRDPDPNLDSDGDGNRNNDVVYYHLTAGDGLALMADGTELYTFGFSDVTALVTNLANAARTQPTAEAKEAKLREIIPAVMKQGLLAANIAGPTLVVKEGQTFHLDLSNVGMMLRPDLFDPHTVHFHGFPQAASIYDGEPMASVSINMGATMRYFYNLVEPGTYFYHCHVEATEHMQMGMIGNLFVLPKQNNLPDGRNLRGFEHRRGYRYAYDDGDGSTRYDVEAPLQVTGFDKRFHEEHIAVQPLPFSDLRDDYPLLNGRGYPDTVKPANALVNSQGIAAQGVSSLVTARRGQTILLRLSNVSESDFHTLTVLGIPMKVVAKDARLLRRSDNVNNLSYDTTSVTLGGGETADVLLDTRNVAAGTYLFYSTRLNHLSNFQEDFGGLMTEIVITP